MNVETYLQQGRMLDQRINYHIRKLEEMRQMARSLSGTAAGGERVRTSVPGDAPFVRALMRIEEEEEKINQEIDLLVDLKQQIREVIRQVDSNELQMMLIYKYLEGKSNDELCELFHLEHTAIKRRHRRAIDQITLPENAIVINSFTS